MPSLSIKPVLAGTLLAALALQTHCTFAPIYTKPSEAPAAAYKEPPPEGEGWKRAEPRDRASRGPWWEVFHDPQLNLLEEQAGGSNQNLAAALARFQAARALVKQSQSQYYPTLTATPSVTRSRQMIPGTPATPATPYTSTQYALTFDASWEVDFWGRIRNSVKASAFEAQATLADLENVRLALQAEVAVDYFEIRGLDAQTGLFQATLASFGEALKLTRIQAETGLASGQDVEQALALFQATTAQATDLGIQRAQLEHAVATLTGRSASSFSLPIHALDAKPVPIPVSLPSELLERRPDIAAAERRVAEANAQIGVARAAYFPATLLGGAVGWEHGTLGRLVSTPNLIWSVGVSLAETVFDGGRRKAMNEQAKAVYLGTVATYRQTVLGAFQDVEDNLSNLHILSLEWAQEDQAVASSQRSLDLAQSRYTAGVDTYLNVLTAQTTLLANQRALLNLRMLELVSNVQLVKALGGSWDTARNPSL